MKSIDPSTLRVASVAAVGAVGGGSLAGLDYRLAIVVVIAMLLVSFGIWYRISLAEAVVVAMPVMFYVPIAGRVNFSLADLIIPIAILKVLLDARYQIRDQTRVWLGLNSFIWAMSMAGAAILLLDGLQRGFWVSGIIAMAKIGIGLGYLWCLFHLFAVSLKRQRYRFVVLWARTATVIAVLASLDSILGIGILRSYAGVRSAGTFEDPNLFGAYLICSLAVVQLASLCGAGRVVRWAAVPAILVAIVFTGSRATLAAALISVVLYVLLLSGQRVGRAWWLNIAIAGGIFFVRPDLLAALSTNGAVVRVRDSLGATTEDSRFTLWREAVSLWREHPILGIGPGRFLGETGHVVHNTYLGILVELGIVGLMLFVSCILYIVFAVLFRHGIGVHRTVLLIGFGGLAVEMATLSLENARFLWGYLALCAAWAVQWAPDRQSEAHSSRPGHRFDGSPRRLTGDLDA